MRKTTPLLAFLLFSCQTLPEIDLKTQYKKTLAFRVNGHPFEGVGTVEQGDVFAIEVSTPDKPTMLRISTCHRDITVSKPGKKYRFTYEPRSREKKPSCLMSIAALDDEGENSWALINFIAEGEDLETVMYCNGAKRAVKGSAICQARVGLVQSLEFQTKVTSARGKGCNTPNSQMNLGTFDYYASRNICQYLFTDGQKIFRLINFGYEKVLNND